MLMAIYVNLLSLRSSSKDIEASANSLDSSGNSLLAAARGAPSYDDQFGPWVQGIAAEARGKSKLHSADVSNLGKRVGRKANEFYAADTGVGKAVIDARNKALDFLEENKWLLAAVGIFGLDRLTPEQWRWLLGFVRWFAPFLFPTFLILVPAAIAKWHGTTFQTGIGPSLPTGGLVEDTGDISEIAVSDAQTWKIPVPADGPTKNHGFPKVGNPSKPENGNCTYYVAQQRFIDFKGNAKDWENNARNAGYHLGAVPRPGSVMVFNPTAPNVPQRPGGLYEYPGAVDQEQNWAFTTYETGHVAYVESVEMNPDGQYIVKVSQRGTEQKFWDQTFVVSPEKMHGISFIYEKR